MNLCPARYLQEWLVGGNAIAVLGQTTQPGQAAVGAAQKSTRSFTAAPPFPYRLSPRP